jgi:hypothetical protein
MLHRVIERSGDRAIGKLSSDRKGIAAIEKTIGQSKSDQAISD